MTGTDRDAAPAEAEADGAERSSGREASSAPSAEADAACTARLDEKGFIGLTTRTIFRDGWLDALAWRETDPAPTAATREGGRWKACDEAWRRVSDSPHLGVDEAARAMFDAGAEWAAAPREGERPAESEACPTFADGG